MAKRTSGRKPRTSKQEPTSIARPILLRREGLSKLSSSSFQLGPKFNWLGAYCTSLPGSGGGIRQTKDRTPPWQICSASNWAELHSELVQLDRQGRVTSLIMLYPALGEMPKVLKDNFSEFEDHCQAVAKADGIEDFPRDPERINELITAGHRSRKGSQKGGSAPKERQGILLALKDFLRAEPRLTCKEAWSRFPGAQEPCLVTTDTGESFEVYRDGEDLIQEDDATAKTIRIKFRTFERYFTGIKKDREK